MMPINTNFYGDETRWFIGTVIDNNDQDTYTLLNRVKVRAVGIHDNIREEQLPWASVVLPTTEGGNGTGGGARIDIGAQVFGIFLDGKNSQYPIVLGSIPKVRGITWNGMNPQLESAVYDTASSTAGTGTTDTVRRPPGATTDEVGIDVRFNNYPDADQPTPRLARNIIYEQYRENGYTDAQARGVIGNFQHESGTFAPDVLNFSRRGDAGTAYGLAQWRKERKVGLLEFARQRNANPKDFRVQVAYSLHELNTTERSAKAELLLCNTPGQAAVSFMRKFERPAKEPGKSDYGLFPYLPVSPSNPRQDKLSKEDERIQFAESYTFQSTPPTRTT